MCPTIRLWTSFFGSSSRHLSKASLAASAKSSLPEIPSLLPNLDSPADIMETNGLLVMWFTSKFGVW